MADHGAPVSPAPPVVAPGPIRRRLRRAVARFLAVVVGIIVALLVAECGARLLTRPDPVTWYVAERGRVQREMRTGLYVPDPVLGWRNRPGARGRPTAPDFAYNVEIDARGRRTMPVGPANPTGRMIVLGDSVAFGYGVEHHETFAALLQARRPGLEVINLSVIGYGTDQELLALRAVLAEPATAPLETVVLTFYLNDMVDVVSTKRWGYNKPRFDLAPDGALRLTGVPAPPPTGFPAAVALDDQLTAHWRSYALARPRVTNLLVRLRLKGAAEGVDEYLGHFLRREAPARERSWRVVEALLTQMAREVRAVGAHLVVLIVPTRAQVVAESRARLQRLYGYRDADLDLEEPEARLGRWGVREGVQVVRALEPFRRVAATGQSPYFAFDLHPNVLGHQVLAAVLEEALGAPPEQALEAQPDVRQPAAHERVHGSAR